MFHKELPNKAVPQKIVIIGGVAGAPHCKVVCGGAVFTFYMSITVHEAHPVICYFSV